MTSPTIATREIIPDEAKFKELILYVATKCQDDESFGAVKLNKILYMIDMFSFGELGMPVTGMEYMKQKAGPVPRRLLPVKKEMERDHDIVEVKRAVYGMANPQKKIIPLRQPDLAGFSATEIAHIDGILELCRDASGTDLSNYTHGHLGWILPRSLGETIPYEAVFLSNKPVTAYEIERAEQLISEHGWNVR